MHILEKINKWKYIVLKQNQVNTRKVLTLMRPSDASLDPVGSSSGQGMHPQFGKWLPDLATIL